MHEVFKECVTAKGLPCPAQISMGLLTEHRTSLWMGALEIVSIMRRLLSKCPRALKKNTIIITFTFPYATGRVVTVQLTIGPINLWQKWARKQLTVLLYGSIFNSRKPRENGNITNDEMTEFRALNIPLFQKNRNAVRLIKCERNKSMRPNRQTDAEPWVRYTGPDHLKDLERDVGLNRGDLLKQAKTGLEPHSRRSNRVVLRRQPWGELMDEEACRNSPWGDKNQVFAR